MKHHLLDFLVCPECQKRFDCRPSIEEGGEILEGILECPQCQRHYPILSGIPRILPPHLSAKSKETADSFGWQWQQFSELHDIGMYKQQFLDWIYPLEPDFFQDKVVLDAGCGMGRFAMASSTFGAAEVIGIDLSDAAIETAHENVKRFSNVHLVQADIYNAPLRYTPNTPDIDFAYTIGVLHHLPDPRKGFHALLRHVKPGGAIFNWVYGYENNGWLIHFVTPLRESISSQLPHRVLYIISLAITLFLHPVLKLLYAPTRRFERLKFLQKALPYSSYLGWLSDYGFHHNHHVVFDHLAAPTVFYIKRQEFASWYSEANLQDVKISWRNRNSWRGFGKRPESVVTSDALDEESS